MQNIFSQCQWWSLQLFFFHSKIQIRVTLWSGPRPQSIHLMKLKTINHQLPISYWWTNQCSSKTQFLDFKYWFSWGKAVIVQMQSAYIYSKCLEWYWYTERYLEWYEVGKTLNVILERSYHILKINPPCKLKLVIVSRKVLSLDQYCFLHIYFPLVIW